MKKLSYLFLFLAYAQFLTGQSTVDCDTIIVNPQILAASNCVEFAKPTFDQNCEKECEAIRLFGDPTGGMPNDEDRHDCLITCDSSIQIYRAVLHAGSSYEWAVNGGTILGANNLDSLIVEWGALDPASVTLIETDVNGCVDSTELCIEFIESPKANFSYSPALPCVNTQIQFQDLSMDATEWLWDFGDGNFSSALNPTHAYSTGGMKTICLLVKKSVEMVDFEFERCECVTACSCTDTIKMNIFIDPKPAPPILCTGTSCVGDTACYTTPDICIGGQYIWTIGANGLIVEGGAVTDTFVCVQWLTGDEGLVTLDVTGCTNDPYCTTPNQATIPIIDPNNLNIEGDTIVCQNSIHQYTIPKFTGSIYDWEVIGGGTILNDPPFTNTISVEWQFGSTGQVVANVQHIKEDCAATDTLDVDIRPEVRIFGQKDVCEGSTITYFPNTFFGYGGSFDWTVTGGTIIGATTGPNVTILWDVAPGTYEITVTPTDTTFYCNASAICMIRVVERPVAPFLVDGPLVICPTDNYAYSADASPLAGDIYWLITGGTATPIFGQDVLITWDATGPYQIGIYQQSSKNPFCISDTTIITLDPVSSITLAGNISACLNSTGSYTGTILPTGTLPPDEEIVWTISPDTLGSVINGQGTMNADILWNNDLGTATITVSYCDGAITDNLTVTLIAPTSPTVTGPDTLCAGTTGTVTVSGTYSSASLKCLDDGSTFSPSGLSNPMFDVPGGCCYLFTGLDTSTGCELSDTICIVEEGPTAQIFPLSSLRSCLDTVTGLPTPLDLSLGANTGSGYSFQWQENCGGGWVNLTVPSATTTIVDLPGTTTIPCSYRCLVTQGSCTEISNVISTILEICDSTCVPENYTLDFTATDCGPTFTFSATHSPNFIDIFYQYGDNQFGSGDTTTHTYDNAACYIVCVKGTLPSIDGRDTCLVETCKTITVPAVVDWDWQFTGCTIDDPSYQFTNLTLLNPKLTSVSYLWTFMDDCTGTTFTSTDEHPLEKICSNCGTTVPITLEVTTVDQDGITCVLTETKNITLAGSTPSATVPTEACVGEKITFVNTSCGDEVWEWDFGDGSNSALEMPCRTYTTPGTYTVTLSTKDKFGCSSDSVFSSTILIHSLPTPVVITAAPTPAEVCEGNAVTLTATAGYVNYEWFDATTNTSLQNGIANTYLASETGFYYVAATDSNGCTAKSDDISVIVFKFPDFEIGGETEICEGDDLVLAAPFGYTYDWVCNGFTYTTFQLTCPNLPIGSHTVTLTLTQVSAPFCSTTVNIPVIVHPNPVTPTISASPSPPFCEGDSVVINIVSPDPTLIYNWSNGLTGTAITLDPAQAGPISVTATNPMTGCSSTRSGFIHPLPDICVVPVGCYEVCDADTICLPNYFAGYQWLQDGLPISGATDSCLIITESGDYQVILTTAAGCIDTSDIMDYTIIDCSDDCADLMAMFTPIGQSSTPAGSDLDSCCWLVDIKNNLDTFITHLEIEILTPGVSFDDFTTHNDFTLDIINPSPFNLVEVDFQNGNIPTGNYPGAFEFCLTDIDSTEVPQVIVIRWYQQLPGSQEVVLCTDTLISDCHPPVVDNDCWTAVVDSVFCDDTNQFYTVNFTITNQNTVPMTQLYLFDLSYPDIDIIPNVITLSPDLGPGNSQQVTTNIVPNYFITDSTNFYFYMAALNNDTLCCYELDSLCVPLVPCCDPCEDTYVEIDTMHSNLDSCCFSLNLHNECRPDIFSKVELEIITPDLIFGSHYIGGPDFLDWQNPVSTSTLVQYQPKTGVIPTGWVDNLINFCIDTVKTTTTLPQQVVIRWISPGQNHTDSIACVDTLELFCPPVEQECVKILSDTIYCLTDSTWQYDVVFQNASTPPHAATDIVITSISPSPPIPCMELMPTAVIPNCAPVGFSCPMPPLGTCAKSFLITGATPGNSIKYTVRLEELFSSFPPPMDAGWCCFESDTFCIEIPSCDTMMVMDDCCQDSLAFCEKVDLGWTVHFDDSCTVTVTAPQFDSCHWFGSPPDFGGGVNQVITQTDGSWTHTYNQNGTYIICTTVFEGDITSSALESCFSKQMCHTIEITNCDTIPMMDDCCKDSLAFCEKVDLGFGISIDHCEVTIRTTQFDSCHWLNSPPDFGDGSPSLPVTTPANGSWTHTYAQNGTYVICATVNESDFSTGESCFSKQMCDTIEIINCDTIPMMDDCCQDSLAFCQKVDLGFSISIDHCEVTIRTTQFDSCHWFNSPPDFGDGSPTLPVTTPANGSWTHTYAQNGTYIICATVNESDFSTGESCFSKQMCDTIEITNCDTIPMMDDCCKDSLAFCQKVDLGWTINFDDKCNVTVTAPQFDSCHWFGAPPNFGDGSSTIQVITPTDGSWTHTYTQNGTYVICSTVYEGDSETLESCFSKQMCDTIDIDCVIDEDCMCIGFTDLVLGEGDEKHEPKCNGKPIQLKCPIEPISIFGEFGCSGTDNCQAFATYTLTGPGLLPQSGIINTASPFTLNFPTSLFTTPGVYSINLEGSCNGMDCKSCRIRFIIPECIDCSCEDFEKDVQTGFNQWTPTNPYNCFTKEFNPIRLEECDKVTWTVNGDEVGNTEGNEPFTFTFSTNGLYTICMQVNRSNPTLMISCPPQVFCQTINVKCKIAADPIYARCDKPDNINGGFTEGTGGVLGEDGELKNWVHIIGKPIYCKKPGYTDVGTVVLGGDKDEFDQISTEVDLAGDSAYVISLAARTWIDIAACGDESKITLIASTRPNGEGESQKIADFTIPTNDCSWKVIELPSWQSRNDYQYLSIRYDNLTDQDSFCTKFIEIDDVCIETVAKMECSCQDLQVNFDWTTNCGFVTFEPSGVFDECDELAWNFNDGSDVIRTSVGTITHIFEDSSLFDVNLTVFRSSADGNCSATIANTVSIDCITDTEELPLKNNVNIFPNPTRNLVQISLDFPFEKAAILRVYNIWGQLLKLQQLDPHIENYTLDLNGMATGFYLVEIQQEAFIYQGRILKQE